MYMYTYAQYAITNLKLKKNNKQMYVRGEVRIR